MTDKINLRQMREAQEKFSTLIWLSHDKLSALLDLAEAAVRFSSKRGVSRLDLIDKLEEIADRFTLGEVRDA